MRRGHMLYVMLHFVCIIFQYIYLHICFFEFALLAFGFEEIWQLILCLFALLCFDSFCFALLFVFRGNVYKHDLV